MENSTSANTLVWVSLQEFTNSRNSDKKPVSLASLPIGYKHKRQSRPIDDSSLDGNFEENSFLSFTPTEAKVAYYPFMGALYLLKMRV